MTDQELAPFEKGAPLMVERYRELRQLAETMAGLNIAAKRTLEEAKVEIFKLRKELEEARRGLNHKEGLTESWRKSCGEARGALVALIHDVEENCGRDCAGNQEVLLAAKRALL